MKDEIKEILDFIKEQIEKETLSYEPDVELSKEETKFLLDYITTLQEENKIKDTNWESLKYYLERLYYKDYIEEPIFDDIDKKIKELESKVEIKGYQKEIKQLQEENERLSKNQRYYKNGVFSLEYDKETMSDMIDDYKSRIDKAINILENSANNKGMCTCNDTDTIQSVLLILRGEE